MPCEMLEAVDICDKCNVGVMCPTGRRSYSERPVSEDKFTASASGAELICDNDACKHQHVNVGRYGSVSSKGTTD